MSRSTQVSNPLSIILVDNNSSEIVCLPRDGAKDLMLMPGETGQISWAEYVKYKSIPDFGRFIKLNDSVVISGGSVKIKNIETDLNDDLMTEILFQSVNRIKEFSLDLNEGEKLIFINFLETRRDIDIEKEKCITILEYITPAPEDDSEVDVEAKPKRGRPKKVDDTTEIVVNKDSLSAHVTKTGKNS